MRLVGCGLLSAFVLGCPSPTRESSAPHAASSPSTVAVAPSSSASAAASITKDGARDGVCVDGVYRRSVENGVAEAIAAAHLFGRVVGASANVDVVAAGKEACDAFAWLSACFESIAPNDPSIAGEATLSLTLDEDGRVKAATASGALTSLAPNLAGCLTTTAKALAFVTAPSSADARFDYGLRYRRGASP